MITKPSTSQTMASNDRSPEHVGEQIPNSQHQHRLVRKNKKLFSGKNIFSLTFLTCSATIIGGGAATALFVVGKVAPEPCSSCKRPSSQPSPSTSSPSNYKNFAMPTAASKTFGSEKHVETHEEADKITITVIKNNESSEANENDKENLVQEKFISEEDLEAEIRRLASERKDRHFRGRDQEERRGRRTVGNRRTLSTFALRRIKEESRL